MPRGMKKGGNVKNGYSDGGLTMVKKDGKMVPDFAADGVGKMAKGGMAGMKGMKKGGSIDGCAQRGKTRLKRGGMC
jgi:hypothetical protein